MIAYIVEIQKLAKLNSVYIFILQGRLIIMIEQWYEEVYFFELVGCCPRKTLIGWGQCLCRIAVEKEALNDNYYTFSTLFWGHFFIPDHFWPVVHPSNQMSLMVNQAGFSEADDLVWPHENTTTDRLVMNNNMGLDIQVSNQLLLFLFICKSNLS